MTDIFRGIANDGRKRRGYQFTILPLPWLGPHSRRKLISYDDRLQVLDLAVHWISSTGVFAANAYGKLPPKQVSELIRIRWYDFSV